MEVNLPLYFVLAALATWRVSFFFVSESGPWGVAKKIRELTGVEHYDDGSLAEIPDKYLAQVFTCIKCFSIYASGFFIGAWLIYPPGATVIAGLFALSAVAILFEYIIEWLGNYYNG